MNKNPKLIPSSSPSTSTSAQGGMADEFLKHAGWLRQLARSLVLDDGEADDLVQETWLAATRPAPKVRNPRAWLAGVLRLEASSHRRQESRRRSRERIAAAERPEAVPAALPSTEVVERERALLDRVGALPESQRSVILARYFEGLSPRAIARRDKTELETVKSRLKRGLAALRSELDREHGTRSAWAAWLLPLAPRPQHALTGVGAVLAAAAFTAVVGTILFALVVAGERNVSKRSARLEPQGEPAETKVATLRAPALEAESSPQRSDAAPPAPKQEVRVLDGRTQAPVPGARVAFVEIESLKDLLDPPVDYLPDVERILLERGTWMLTDKEGSATLRATPPYIVRAGNEATFGSVHVSELSESVEITLQPVAQIQFEVKNERGASLDDVPVRATLTLEGSGSSSTNADRLSFVRRTREGRAWFQNPLMIVESELRTQSATLKPVWTEFLIDLPGVPELVERGKIRTEFELFDERGPFGPFEFVLPPMGSLEVLIEDEKGRTVSVEGVARLQVIGHKGRRYEADLVEGCANWPRVMLGHDFTIELSVPSLGSQWTVDGTGPVAADEPVILRTRAPKRPGLSGRLLTMNGRPHSRLKFTVYHGFEGRRATHRALQAETDEFGVFRFEWPDTENLESPLQIVSEDWEKSGSLQLDLSREAMLEDHNLGDLTLSLSPPKYIRGHVFDPQGNPLSGVDLTVADVHGTPRGVETGPSGAFELAALYGEGFALECRDTRGRFMSQTLRFTRADAESELRVVMGSGTKVVGQIDRGDLFDDGLELSLYLSRPDSEERSFGTVQPDGSFETTPVSPGTYSLELRRGLNGTLARIEDLHLGREEKRVVTFPLLEELLRPVKLVPVNMTDHTLVQVLIEGPSGILSMTRGLRGKKEILVPRSGTWSIKFISGERRSLLVEDVHSLPSTYELHLPEPLRIILLTSGEHPKGKKLELRGLANSPTEHEIVQVPRDVDGDGRVEIEIPAPGSYRLNRSEASGMGSGVMSMTTDPTTEVLEFLDTEELQELRIQLDAPLQNPKQ